ncbi:unnamed protein product [Orchesella dallaii]|uniref:Carboxylesterase type B domain-containing protein n=1 Tax=Orchesella dallaii TaxID=48710 RepID=A0ABP1QXT5_9HEXA
MALVFLFYLLCALTDCPPPISHYPSYMGQNRQTRHRSVFTSSIFAEERFARSHLNKLLSADLPIVSTSLGKIQGRILESRGGRYIAAFEGVAYAQPPIQEYRFRDPVPTTPWTGILDATKTRLDCLQLDISRQFRVRGGEDCLYLNVYTPLSAIQTSKNKTRSISTIFYIHGGAWLSLSGSGHGPRYLLDKDVILVTLNYRLGVLGFLSTGDRAARGNYALKDQVQALEWTAKHISSFGGDPKKITVMGESVGAAATALHIISPLTSKVIPIQGAIMHSGSSLNHWILVNDTFTNTKIIASRLNCPTTNSEHLVECLRQRDPYMIVAQQFLLWKIPVITRLLFGPVIESKIDNPNAFIVEHPEVTYSKPETIRPIPVIAGVNRNEGGLFAASVDLVPFLYKAINSKRDEMISYAMDYDRISGINVAETSEKISKFYFNNKPWSYKNRDRISDVLGDRAITTGVYKFLQLHSQVAPTYGYFYNHESPSRTSYLSQLMGTRKNDWGVSHGDETPYIFSVDHVSNDFNDPLDLEISRFLVDTLVNFSNNK